ncbi:hypothetical protein E2C01_018383 [Portunus trituberculatus]|uniref:Uncharacterized protein n=1 Tax=Portunus trituberculatus TaxID=210409 RepID=A0A5B7DVZ7_PORTR|nr:hypothetical protein [Portunus trituberculatus]
MEKDKEEEWRSGVVEVEEEEDRAMRDSLIAVSNHAHLTAMIAQFPALDTIQRLTQEVESSKDDF